MSKTNAHENRDKILHAASELFLVGGLASLSVRSIARKAGLSTIGIYSHFDGKQGILDALYIEGFERVGAAMQEALGIADAEQQITTACTAYLDVAVSYPAHYRLIFGSADDTYTPSVAAQQAARQAFQTLLELTAAAVKKHAADASVHELAIELWAVLHGFVGLNNIARATNLPLANWRSLALRSVQNAFAAATEAALS